MTSGPPSASRVCCMVSCILPEMHLHPRLAVIELPRMYSGHRRFGNQDLQTLHLDELAGCAAASDAAEDLLWPAGTSPGPSLLHPELTALC